YTAEGNGIKDTYNKLNTQLATLDAVVNGAAPAATAGAPAPTGPANGAVKDVVPAGATAERTIQLRDGLASKIDKYNEAATRAKAELLKADALTPKKDEGAAATPDPKTPAPAATVADVETKMKAAKDSLTLVADKMDAFIAANPPPAEGAAAATPAAGATAAPPVKQAEVDPVLTNVSATVTAQSANLDALLKDVQGVQPRGSGTP
ncbi:MAG: hypothetical protein HY079_03660, partial [Elusimicrobia bacterium]|nr:hypothetical protein [Elusimicrobiota bacterium]